MPEVHLPRSFESSSSLLVYLLVVSSICGRVSKACPRCVPFGNQVSWMLVLVRFCALRR
jgi:hypothetical protein